MRICTAVEFEWGIEKFPGEKVLEKWVVYGVILSHQTVAHDHGCLSFVLIYWVLHSEWNFVY